MNRRKMVKLHPKNFNRLPFGYRPKGSVEVNSNFAKKVKRVNRNGPRADDEDIANVVTVVENMRTYTPSLFRKHTRKHKRNSKKHTRRNRR
jgi:hypothetical protein